RVELRRAETHLKLTKLLLESGEPRPARKDTPGTEVQLANAQRRFALGCRNVDELLRAVKHPAGAPAPAGRDSGARPGTAADREEVRERLESLQQENRTLTDRHGRSSLRREAERLARRGGRSPVAAIPDEGVPTDARAATWDVESLAEAGRPYYRLSGGTSAPASASIEVAAPALVTSAGLERRRA